MFQESNGTRIYGVRPPLAEFRGFIERSRPNHYVQRRHMYPVLVTLPCRNYCTRGWAYEDIAWEDISRAKQQKIKTELAEAKEPLYSVFVLNRQGKIYNPLKLTHGSSYIAESCLVLDWDALGLADSLTVAKLEELFCKKTQALCLNVRNQEIPSPNTLESIVVFCVF